MREKIDDIRDWLRASYRPEVYQDLYETLLWISDAEELGNRTSGSAFTCDLTNFPHFPKLKPKRPQTFQYTDGDNGRLPESRLKDTFNAVTLMTAKLRASQIEPIYPDLTIKQIGDARTAIYQKRSVGNHCIPGFQEHINRAVFDGNVAGYGVVQLGTRTNPKTGQKLASLKRHRPLNVLFDPGASTISESTRICFVHDNMSVDTAEKYTGIPHLESYSTSENFSFVPGGRKVVQVFEYFSYEEGCSPTRCCIVGGMNSDAYKITDNNFEMVPFSAMEYLYVDGMEMPQGATFLSANLEAQKDAIRKRIQIVAELHSILAINPDGISSEDWGKVSLAVAGKGPMPHLIRGRRKQDGQNRVPAFEHYQGAELNGALMPLLEFASREFQAISGVGEPDRGQSIAGVNTLGEYQDIASRSGALTTYGAYKSATFIQNMLSKFGHVASLMDTDPLTVPVDGVVMTLNDGDPATSFESVYEEESSILVSESELFGAQGDMKTRQRIQELMAFGQQPGVNPVEVASEIARLMGLDAQQFVQQPQPAQGMPGMPPGMPAGMTPEMAGMTGGLPAQM
jgi:hypothetical protein